MILQRTIDAASEALSLNEVKNQLRVTTTADDNAFRQFIAAIRKRTEWYLGKSLITCTWSAKLDAFPDDGICLPMGPVQSITSISYVDTDGNNQSFTDFQFSTDGRLKPAYGFSWPSTRDQMDAVTVTYVAGAADAGEVEEDVKQAMLLWIGSMDIGRENTVIGAGVVVTEIPSGAESLLAPHKNWSI